MRPIVWMPIALFAAGIACVAAAMATGDADVHLFVIFPIFSGSSLLFLLGTLLIVLSFFAGFAMLALGRREIDRIQSEVMVPGSEGTPQNKTSYGGVVLIGPVPIAFGSSKNLAILMFIIGIALAVLILGALLLT